MKREGSNDGMSQMSQMSNPFIDKNDYANFKKNIKNRMTKIDSHENLFSEFEKKSSGAKARRVSLTNGPF